MLTFAQERLIYALSQLHFLTAEQLSKLYYSPGSITHVHRLMKNLFDNAYVDRFYIARSTRWGSNPLVYTLSHRGVTYLNRLGIDAFQTHHSAVKTYTWLAEVLAINDFLIAATLLQRVRSEITLPRALHERTIRHVHVSPLIPDSWLEFHVQDTTSICIWLEMDMGTEQETFFRKKISAILDFARNGYAQTFGTDSLIVAVATHDGENRAYHLLLWIEKELKGRYEKDKHDLFRVVALPQGQLDPQSLFFEPTWYIPFLKQHGSYFLYPLLPSLLAPASGGSHG